MLSNIFASVAVGIGLVASGIFGMFGLQHGTTTMNDTARFAASAALGTTTQSTVVCVAQAVTTREKSLESGVATYTTSINGAYSARANAILTAYGQPSTSAIASSIKAAWSTFASTTKAASKTWRAAQESAWSTYDAAIKACKAPASLTDQGDSSLDVEGQ